MIYRVINSIIILLCKIMCYKVVFFFVYFIICEVGSNYNLYMCLIVCSGSLSWIFFRSRLCFV